jgi:acyl-CoA reductase-like NAD-dependent aldehyde dehydrogenase
MVERLLPAEDPVSEEVLEWTVARDARDITRLMRWLGETQSQRDRAALLSRARELLTEIEEALQRLSSMQ